MASSFVGVDGVVFVGEWSCMCVGGVHRDEDTAQAWGMVKSRYSEARGGAMRVVGVQLL